MAAIPSYAGVPKLGIGQVTVANPNRDGTGAIAIIFTAGASGSRIDSIALKAVVTTTAGTVRLFIHDGAATHLLAELSVQAVTPAATTPAWEAQLNTNSLSQILPIILPTGYSLRASTEKAEAINVIAVGGDF